SAITAISTTPGGTSLYLVGSDEGHGGGRVWTNFYPSPEHPDQWTGWFPLADNVFPVPQG
ncbi:hypothetical protein, partial [Actinocorallia longicatena]|uniref:hypothetical protein n=1 Tax=Actinocorallia longicatena TaxID=111803 RepID=UPI0031DCEFD2